MASRGWKGLTVMIIRPVGTELFHAGGRADGRTNTGDEANSRFLKLCEST